MLIAPVVGGRETLIATVGRVADSVELTISEPNIVAVPRQSAYYFIWKTDNHFPADSFARRGVVEVLDAMFAGWAAKNDSARARFPFAGHPDSGRRFKVDAMALPFGGLYDHRGTWGSPHQLHRTGMDVDFNDGDNGGAELVPDDVKTHCRDFRYEGAQLRCKIEYRGVRNQHYHIYFYDAGTGGRMRLATSFRVAAAAAASAVAGTTIAAQQVGSTRFDAARGSYFVTVRGDSGMKELEVFPANGARASVRVVATPVATNAWRYTYRISVGADTRQALSRFEVSCARVFSPRDIKSSEFVGGTGARLVVAGSHAYDDREVCAASPTFALAGDSVTLELTANAAPGLGTMRLIGRVPAVVWPEDTMGDENRRAEAVIDSIGGITGGWHEVVTVAPVRSPGSTATPALTVSALQDDLTAACESLALIAPAGICNSLRAKLNAARQSIERGNANAATGQVSALLLELDAQRGKHVQEPAYIVLHTLASLLQSQLAR